MINLEFAPNEDGHSAMRALAMLLQPWHWRHSAYPKRLRALLSDITQTDASGIFLMLSARGALKIFLESLRLPAGSEVLVPGFTCEAVVLPALALGLTPVYVDIEKETYGMDLEDFNRRCGPRAKVVVLQHTFGMTPKFRADILALASRGGMTVIEDLAHGFHPSVFSQSPADRTTKLFSFGRSKLFSSVHGGAIAIPDTALAARFGALHEQLPYPSHAFVLRTLLYKVLTPFIKATRAIGIGRVVHRVAAYVRLFTTEISAREKRGEYDAWLEKKLPAALAQIAFAEVRAYEDVVKARADRAHLYATALGISMGSSLPVLRFPLLVEHRAEVKEMLRDAGLIVGNWYDQPVAPSGLDLTRVG